MLKPDGTLAFVGYSPEARFTWNPEPLSACMCTRYSLKGWDYYYVSTEDFHLSLGLVDISYAGNVFLTYYSKSEGVTTEEQVLVGSWHGVSLSSSSLAGTASFDNNDWRFTFENKETSKVLTASAPVLQVSSMQGFSASLEFKLPESTEGLFVMNPITSDGSKFFISHKNYGYEVTGEVRVNGKIYKLEREPGVMDWVRSKWPYTGGWIWATGVTSKSSEIKASVNLSSHSQTSSGPSEDAVILNGKLVKLGLTTFQIDTTDLSKDILIKSLSDQPTNDLGVVTAVFHPQSNFNKSVDYLIISSELVMIFGEYEVTLRTLTETVHFKARGLIEVHKSRW